MKIRSRLTLWYFSISFFILIIFCGGTYYAVKNLLFNTLDKELDVIATTIEQSYDMDNDDFSELSRDPDSADFAQYYLVLYNRNKYLVYSSRIARKFSFHIPITVDKYKISYLVDSKVPDRNEFFNSQKNGNITFRLMNRRLINDNKTVGWITVGLPIGHIEYSMDHLIYYILIGGFMGILLISVGSYFLIQKTLSPVNIITKKANQISKNNLDERIKIYNQDDELGQLSIVLNNLLNRLQTAFESQQQFMADAAHELKTPLSILRSNWESELNNPEITLDLKEKFVKDIETITRLNHLINNLLLLSQTESPKSQFEFKKVRIDEVLREAVSDIKILADIKSQKITIKNFLPEIVLGDKLRLFQLFFNLLENGVKYTPQEGEITLNVKLSSDFAIVEISDNGPGIPEDDLPFIFDRFYRVQKDRARKSGGTGLGLSICKLVAELHKGKIEVHSKTGEGTTFRVMLPLYKPQQESGNS
jgi:signal transduction histidine kinase